MDKTAQRCIFIFVFLTFFITIPYFIFSYAQDATTSATGCFILNQSDLPSGAPLPAGCDSESAIVQNVIKLAKEHLATGIYIMGTPSRDWASDKSLTSLNYPPNFDCSGFVGWAWYWGSNGVISMLGQTNADWSDTSNSHYEKVVTTDESQLQPGDAVYFNDHLNYPQPFHVGLYVGTDPGSACKANDCFLQYYSTGFPGDEESIKGSGATMMGYIRMKNP